MSDSRTDRPLDLPAAGVKTNDQGIVVDETLRTSVAHIWAVGDVLGIARRSCSIRRSW